MSRHWPSPLARQQLGWHRSRRPTQPCSRARAMPKSLLPPAPPRNRPNNNSSHSAGIWAPCCSTTNNDRYGLSLNTVQLRDRAVQYDGAAEWLGQARVGSSSVGFGVGRVADQGFPSGCCRCGGRRSWADGATAAGVAGAGGDLFFDWDGAAFRGLLRGRVRATHRWSVVDDGMGAVVVSADEIGYLSSTFTIGVRTAT